jgi:mannose-6-phosphate isomerase-like protein (cupin superfamily)
VATVSGELVAQLDRPQICCCEYLSSGVCAYRRVAAGSELTWLPIDSVPAPVLCDGDEGGVFWCMGNSFSIRLRSTESAGALALLEVVAPVGTAPPLHVHHREAEVFYLLEGAMIYRAGDDAFELAPGSSIYLPKDVPHAFRVIGHRPARFLALTAPGGIEALYEQLGRPPARDGLPDKPSAEEIGSWLRAAETYGLEICGPPLPELV